MPNSAIVFTTDITLLMCETLTWLILLRGRSKTNLGRKWQRAPRCRERKEQIDLLRVLVTQHFHQLHTPLNDVHSALQLAMHSLYGLDTALRLASVNRTHAVQEMPFLLAQGDAM